MLENACVCMREASKVSFLVVFFLHWVGISLSSLLLDCMPAIQTLVFPHVVVPCSGVPIFPCSRLLLSLYLLDPHLSHFPFPMHLLNVVPWTYLSCSTYPGNASGATKHNVEEKLSFTAAHIRGQQLHCHCCKLENTIHQVSFHCIIFLFLQIPFNSTKGFIAFIQSSWR